METWNHFEKLDEGVKCIHCSVMMSSDGTSNLRRHMKRKHHSVPVNRTQSVPANEPQPSTSADNTRRIDIFFISLKSLPSETVKHLDKLLIVMICKEYHPFSIVEDTYFRNFIKALNPNYELPSRKTLSNAALPKLYNQTLDIVKTKLIQAYQISLTCDGWTSLNNNSFFALTAHFIDNNFRVSSVLLQCSEFESNHTGSNIASWITNITKKFDIDDRIFAVVTDNASNMKAAVNELKLPHLPCAAHTINLIVQKAIHNNIGLIIEQVKSIVALFKKSSKALKTLTEIQQSLKFDPLKLKQECPTRWNSTFEMLNRFYKNKIPIVSCLAVLKITCHLTDNDWQAIDQAIKILGLINLVTTEIMAEKCVTISKLGVLINSINIQIREKITNLSSSPVKKLGEEIVKGLIDKFNTENYKKLVPIAILLDPRFKKEGFVGNARDFAEAYESVIEKLIPYQAQECRSEPGTEDVPEDDKEDDIWGVLKRFSKPEENISQPRVAAAAELDAFLKEKKLKVNEDPLLWWKSRVDIYPTLVKLCKQYLSVPGTSVSCERIFSKTGQIVTDRRNRLKGSKVEQIVFVQNNYE